MYLLDTDHLTLLERGGALSSPLLDRLAGLSPDDVASSIVSYEEQTRGWMAFLARTQTSSAQVEAYRRLQRHLEVFCSIPLLEFDPAAALTFAELQRQRVRIGTMDLKIAAIALTRDAVLLTRNHRDFGKVPGLRIEDWTG